MLIIFQLKPWANKLFENVIVKSHSFCSGLDVLTFSNMTQRKKYNIMLVTSWTDIN